MDSLEAEPCTPCSFTESSLCYMKGTAIPPLFGYNRNVINTTELRGYSKVNYILLHGVGLRADVPCFQCTLLVVIHVQASASSQSTAYTYISSTTWLATADSATFLDVRALLCVCVGGWGVGGLKPCLIIHDLGTLAYSSLALPPESSQTHSVPLPLTLCDRSCSQMPYSSSNCILQCFTHNLQPPKGDVALTNAHRQLLQDVLWTSHSALVLSALALVVTLEGEMCSPTTSTSLIHLIPIVPRHQLALWIVPLYCSGHWSCGLHTVHSLTPPDSQRHVRW